MGIINRGGNMGTSKVAMRMEEFKEWVLRDVDADQDGKISKDELAEAVGRRGEWFAGLKARKGMRSADSNRNGVLDDIEITNLAEFAQKHLGIMIIEPFAKWSPGGMDSRDGKHRHKKMSDRLNSIKFPGRKPKINAEKPFQASFFENNDFTEHITEAGLPSAPAKSEAESMILTEEQLKEVFKRFEAKEEPDKKVLHRVELKKAFNHFGLFFPHHAATVFDAKKEGSVKLTELDDLVNSAVRLGYTVN
ncbi:CALCIUM BINDING PROTEIN [Salix viminalis]|uniref:CALCIUM BINDING PROTEIN n=1 Tax=Salix viminalis TaxID=40686 RepID=A0A9Q0NTX7_SALVM|nr:CALCIUM BINDING PROTEIN [Salix viminalis]